MSSEIESLGSAAGAIGALVLLAAAAWGLSGLLLGPLAGTSIVSPVAARGDLDRSLLRLTLGTNLIAWLGALLGQLGWLTGYGSLGLLLLAAAPLVFTAVRPAAAQHSLRRLSPCAAAARRHPLLAGSAALLVVVTLGPALAFPTGWDELVYHAVLPRRWLADGRLTVYSDLPYSGFPSLGEILFWLVAPLEGLVSTRLLSWSAWLLGLALVYRLLRRYARAADAGTLTLTLAVSQTLLLTSANCYVEAFLLANTAGAMLALALPGRRWLRQAGSTGPVKQRPRFGPDLERALLVGLLVGSAAAVKLTGLAVLALPCIAYALDTRARGWRRLALLGACLVAAGVAALPFYVRPWIATGNPCYPYFAQWFTTDAATIEMSRYHHALGSVAFGVSTWPAFLLGPVLLAFAQDNYDGTFGWQIVAWLLLAGLAVRATWRRPRPGRVLVPLAGFLLLYTFWFLTAQQARFAIPAILPLLVLTAQGLSRLRPTGRLATRMLLAAAALVSAPWGTAGHYLGSWMSVCRLIPHSQYVDIETDGRYLPLVRLLAEATPADARLLLLFEHRGLYLPRTHVIGTPFFQAGRFTPPEAFASPARVLEVLRRERITHVVLTKSPAGPDIAPAWLERAAPLDRALTECTAAGHLRPIGETPRHIVLAVQ